MKSETILIALLLTFMVVGMLVVGYLSDKNEKL